MIPSRPDLRRFIQPLEPPVSDAQAKRLHANFVEIQQMTNRDGVDTLRYSLHATAIGLVIIGSILIDLKVHRSSVRASQLSFWCTKFQYLWSKGRNSTSPWLHDFF